MLSIIWTYVFFYSIRVKMPYKFNLGSQYLDFLFKFSKSFSQYFLVASVPSAR